MQKLTNSISNDQPPKDKEFQLDEMDPLKKSELFSASNKQKFHRWLDKEDKEEVRLKSFNP